MLVNTQSKIFNGFTDYSQPCSNATDRFWSSYSPFLCPLVRSEEQFLGTRHCLICLHGLNIFLHVLLIFHLRNTYLLPFK